MRGLGIGRIKRRGVSRGEVCVHYGGVGCGSPIWDISARRALWLLNSVCIVVVIVGDGCCASVDMRINQWSRGALLGVYVGVSGSPKF